MGDIIGTIILVGFFAFWSIASVMLTREEKKNARN